MNKIEAYKIVFENLKQYPPFRGINNSNVNRHYMYGIASVMESIAYTINEQTGQEFSKTFMDNLINNSK